MSNEASGIATSASGPSEPYVRPTIRPNAVEVTGDDFNGSTWDGTPFRGTTPETPEWLRDAVNSGRLKVSNVSGSTDYAVWDVDCGGKIVRALPSDQIEHLADGSLIVHEYPEKYRHPSRLPL